MSCPLRYFIDQAWEAPRTPGDKGPRRFVEEEREVTREQYEAFNRSMVASCGPKESR